MKKRKIIVSVCFVLLLIITVLMPVFDYFTNGKVTSTTIRNTIVLLVGDFLFLIKNVVAYASSDKKTYKTYESEYDYIIGKAFLGKENEKSRKELLRAIDLYNQNKFNLSREKLEKLRTKCVLSSDRYAVDMFIALAYTDSKMYNEAVKSYEKILSYDVSKSDVWSNLGYVYEKQGNFDKSVECYMKSIECDTKNPYPYNNLAQALYSQGYYEDAIEFSKKALEIKSNFYQSANCLALCYCALGDDENSRHYAKIAISNGSNADNLNFVLKKMREVRNTDE